MQLLDILQSLFGEPQPGNRLAAAATIGPNAEDRPGYLPPMPVRGEMPARFVPQQSLPEMAGGQGIGTFAYPAPPRAEPAMDRGFDTPNPRRELSLSTTASPAAAASKSGGSSGGFGTFVQKLFDPDAEARNVTVDWLQKKGYSPNDARLITANKPMLQAIINDHYKSKQPSEFDQRAVAAQRYGLTGEQLRTFALTGDLPKPVEAKRSVQTIYDRAGNEQKVWLDENTGQMTPLGGSKSAILSPEEEAQKTRIANAGRSQINVGSGEGQYDKTLGEGYAKRYLETRDMAVNAGKGLNTIAVMRQAMNQPGFYSGTASGAVEYGKRLLASLGLSDEAVKGVSSMETFNAMSKQAALDLMGGSLGTGFSNADRDFVTGQVANLGNTPEGNKQLLDIQEKMLMRTRQIGSLANEYAKNNGGRIDAGFDEFLTDWSEKNPLFPQPDKPAQQPWYRRDDQGPSRIRNPEQPAQKWRAKNPDTGEAIEWNGNAWVPAQ